MVKTLADWVMKIYMLLLRMRSEKQEHKFTFNEASNYLLPYSITNDVLRKAFQQMIKRDWMIVDTGHPSKKDYKMKYYRIFLWDEMFEKFDSTSSEPS